MPSAAFCYITFPTTYFAIRAETLLKGKKYTIKMVPVPRSISSSCGTSLRCLESEAEKIRLCLQENKVIIDGIYYV